MEIYLTIAGVGAVLAGLQLMVYLRLRSVTETVDDRLSHLTAGIALLTDTTESGLRDVAVELNRQGSRAAAPRPQARVATQRRIAGAARQGRSVQKIAAAEQISEGEVSLRLNLDQSRKGQTHAQVR